MVEVYDILEVGTEEPKASVFGGGSSSLSRCSGVLLFLRLLVFTGAVSVVVVEGPR